MSPVLPYFFNGITILLLLGIPVFFTCRWVVKKFVKTEQKQELVTWVATFVLTPLIYLGLTGLLLLYICYVPSRDFNRETWLAQKTIRYQMRDDLVESKLLLGKTGDGLTEMIGPPEYQYPNGKWVYELGASTAGFGWAFYTLIVDFENGRVVKVDAAELID